MHCELTWTMNGCIFLTNIDKPKKMQFYFISIVFFTSIFKKASQKMLQTNKQLLTVSSS